MKVTFIVVWASTKIAVIFDKHDWPTRNYELEKVSLAHTKKLLKQISSIPIEKEILLMDNTGDFPSDFTCDDLIVTRSHGAWTDEEAMQNTHLFTNVADKFESPGYKTCAATTCSLAFQHGVELATGDYIIMQHNDTSYLFDYYDKSIVITDAIDLLEKNNYEYITIDKKPIKNRDYAEWNDKIEYYADCYWFLCKADFYKKHNIWVDWGRGDTNHLATITCVTKNLPFLHLPFFYEGSDITIPNDTHNKLKEFYKEYPEFKQTDLNIHLLNDIPFIKHYKGGTTLSSFLKKKDR
jgi:hypothetical protein